MPGFAGIWKLCAHLRTRLNLRPTVRKGVANEMVQFTRIPRVLHSHAHACLFSNFKKQPMYRPLIAQFLLALSGCAQMPAGQFEVGGNGRFLQLNTNGQIIVQIDMNSNEECKREGRQVDKRPEIEMLCSTVSQQSVLPYSFPLKNISTNDQWLARVKTMDGCEVFRKEMERYLGSPDNAQLLVKAGKCT